MKFGILFKLVPLILFILLMYWGTSTLINKNVLVVDELDHYDQIIRFYRGNYVLNPKISAVPGYHFLIAGILKILNTDATATLRYAVTVVNCAAAVMFYLLARTVDRKGAYLKTLQFLFLPILMPMFILMYTDAVSLALILGSLFLVIKRRYWLGGLVGIAGLAVRQDNVVWLLFLMCLVILEEVETEKLKVINIINVIKISLIISKKIWVFGVGVIMFGVFVLINGGVAIGQREMHPLAISNLGNVYFSLLITFFLFGVIGLGQYKKMAKMVNKYRIMLIPIAIWVLIFLATFNNSHPFNQSDWFLRNRMLVFLTQNIFWRVVFFIGAAIGALFLATSGLIKKEYYIFYVFWIISLVPESLIEQRYYLIPLTLFILLRKPIGERAEVVNLGLWVGVGIILFKGIVEYRYFL